MRKSSKAPATLPEDSTSVATGNKNSAVPLRKLPEMRFARELAALKHRDVGMATPLNWQLSPIAVRDFICGAPQPISHDWEGETVNTVISQKFYGDDALVERAIVTLMSQRGLMLVGEPGTAKSMLSELLAVAIGGTSTLTVQGTAGTTEDQIKYAWNYALLLAEGPSDRALVPSPIFTAMKTGKIARFEELTRCAAEIQDSLISILSEKNLYVPELGDAGLLLAAPGFNLIATANLRDRGVSEMSSALKRRFNFETIHPIADRELEKTLIDQQVRELMAERQLTLTPPPDVLDLLVTVFQELRQGRTQEGTPLEKPTAVMSTAEAVGVALSALLDASYFTHGDMTAAHVARQIGGTVFKDDNDDWRRFQQYLATIGKMRAKTHDQWKAFYQALK